MKYARYFLVLCSFSEKHYFYLRTAGEKVWWATEIQTKRLKSHLQGTGMEKLGWSWNSHVIWQNHTCCLQRDTNLRAHKIAGSAQTASFLPAAGEKTQNDSVPMAPDLSSENLHSVKTHHLFHNQSLTEGRWI